MGGVAPTTVVVPGQQIESYEIAKTKLNQRIYGSLGGVYWPHSYLYCRRRQEIYDNDYLKLFSDEIPILPATIPYGSENGEMIGFTIQSSVGLGGGGFGEWPVPLTPYSGIATPGASLVNVPHTFSDNTSNLIDRFVPASFYGPVWVEGVTDWTPAGIPMITAGANWYAGTRQYSAPLVWRPSMQIMRTSYYAENVGRAEAMTGDMKLPDYIKLVYNTGNPTDASDVYDRYDNMRIVSFGDADDLGGPNPGGKINVSYPHSWSPGPSRERRLLQHYFGSTIADGRRIIGTVLDDMCGKIKLLQSKTNRMFLRNGQPNKLFIKDLEKVTSYIEYNSSILSILQTSSLIGRGTGGSSMSVYDPPSMGSY
jgi:hypothetical protein